MKKYLKIFLWALFTSTMSCKKNDKILNRNTLESTDTLFLENNSIVFINPSEEKINKLKKQNGNNFYTIADDANFYFANATEYLDSLKTKYFIKNENTIIGYKSAGKFIEIPKYKNPWYTIFYKENNYKTVDLIMFNNEYDTFFNDSKANNISITKSKIIDSIASTKYFVVKQKECDLNQDGNKDVIIIFGNNNDINSSDLDTKIAPIAILLNAQNEKYKVITNYNIYPNDYGDAFKNLVIKNSFFTIELSNEVPDNYISKKYITFKYEPSSQKIILHKYGENINWANNTSTNILSASKTFGKILFNDFNSNTIKSKINRN